MDRIVITGGAGFIGRNLISTIKRCYPEICEIVVIDNESMSSFSEIAHLGTTNITGDIRDKELLKNVFSSANVVVHLAADTRVLDSIADPVNNFENNVIGTFNVLCAAKECGITQVVSASTGGAILGDASPPVDESMPANPLSPYGASKLAAEGYMSAFSGSFGLRTCALRFSNVYGPGSIHKGSVVAHFYKRILSNKELIVYGDGEQTRDYVYVEDLTFGIVNAIKLQANGVYQLGSGEPTTINELINYIRQVTERSDDISVVYENAREGEVKNTWCNISKAKAQINYNPQTELYSGLQKTWSWFIKHGKDL